MLLCFQKHLQLLVRPLTFEVTTKLGRKTHCNRARDGVMECWDAV